VCTLARAAAAVQDAWHPTPIRARVTALRRHACAYEGEDDGMTTRALSHTGWVTFAGTVALVAGAYNGVSGLSTVTSDYARIEEAQEVLFGINVDAWGWFWLIIGAVQLLTGFLLLARNSWGLMLGVSIAGLSALMAVFAIFEWPLWAFSVLTLDLLVIYALLTHGDEFV
jgi:hypothetical protein